MRLVILESPFAGDVEKNLAYVRACMRDCLLRGDAPMASHALYTQPGVLDDNDSEERKLGIEAGLCWGRVAEATVVYINRGISRGMREGIERARREGRPVEVRSLPEWGEISITLDDARLLRSVGIVVVGTTFADARPVRDVVAKGEDAE